MQQTTISYGDKRVGLLKAVDSDHTYSWVEHQRALFYVLVSAWSRLNLVSEYQEEEMNLAGGCGDVEAEVPGWGIFS